MQVRLGKTAGACLLALLWVLLAAVESLAGQPTPDQVSAIKSNCRSDFLANCRGVPRGGAEAVQCLKQHLANLSPGCQSAVKAISPPAPPQQAAPAPQTSPAEPAPATSPAAIEPPAAAVPETSAPEAEAPMPAAPPQAAPAPAPKPPVKAASPPAARQSASPPPSAATSSPAPKVETAAPATPEAEEPIIGFIPPRKQLMVLRNCRQDLGTYCAGVEHGEGRQLRCLLSNRASLTPDCQGALARLSR
jgi:outer membrane biosynthesis protein TonB